MSSVIDLVMNFTCVALPKAYYASPILTYVLEVKKLLKYSIIKIPILQASISEVYGDSTFDILQETYCGNVSCICPRPCYDDGKIVAETLCIDYHLLFGTLVRMVKIFNTYGSYIDRSDGRTIPEFICRSLENDDIMIFGDGSQTRSFIYIDDLINGIIEVMNSEHDLDYPFNIGNPNEEHSIEYIAKTVIGWLVLNPI